MSRHHPPGGSPDAADAIACEEALERVYEYLDGELGPDWTDKVSEHLELCRKCYPLFNFERVFLDHVRDMGLAPRATATLEARVREALKEA